MDHFVMLTPHQQQVKYKNLKTALHYLLYSKSYNFQNRLIKDLPNPLWTTRNST